tara:strand:- start:2668 stop:3339 length:672 start_codon:yes stop_codon:yes gene_type:complete
MFGFNKTPQQNGALNLSMSGAPMNNQYGNNLGVGLPSAQFAPQQQPNGFMGGMMGGMGMNQQQQMMMQNGQVTPPSEMEIMAALLQSQNPIHRFIAEGGLATVIDLVATATSLSLINILKNATFSMNEDDNGMSMKLDATALPSELQTLSAENVSMLLNNIVAQSTQTVQQAEMQRQQIMAMAQQSMMGGALSAALADEGMMNKVGGGIGSVARGLIGLPTNK